VARSSRSPWPPDHDQQQRHRRHARRQQARTGSAAAAAGRRRGRGLGQVGEQRLQIAAGARRPGGGESFFELFCGQAPGDRVLAQPIGDPLALRIGGPQGAVGPGISGGPLPG